MARFDKHGPVRHAPGSRKVWAAGAAMLVAAALSACGGTPGPVAAPVPTPAATGGPAVAASAEAEPAPQLPTGKLRGYGTVRELTETADLVARGRVEAAGFRIEEVLFAAEGAGVKPGDRITLTGLNGKTVDSVNMSRLEPGQHVVLYLARDAVAAAFGTLTGDFGVFDVTGTDASSAVSTRSKTMAVSGLLTEDPAAAGNGFSTTLGQLRALAARRAGK